MGDYASKGLANGLGIPALVLGSLGFLGSGGLGGGLFGNNNAAILNCNLSRRKSRSIWIFPKSSKF